MEKDIVYHALKDCMTDGSCPICAQTETNIRSTMRSVLYESMTDVEIRDTIKNARGFCRHHSNMFLEEGDALNHAIVYGDALRSALQDVVNGDYKYYEERQNCYFCDMAREAEDAYTKACWDAFHDEEFFSAYEKGGLLCMVHLHAMETASEKEKNGEEFYLKLAQSTIDKYQVMIRQLDEIIRKSDYRNLGEAWTDGEKTAWRRAVNVIHDKVGIPRTKQKPKRGLFSRK